MTVVNTTDRTEAVGTNAVGQIIPFSFPISLTSDLVVKTRLTATGAETTFVNDADYTVTIDGTSGGWITMITAVASTSTIHLIRRTPSTQLLDLQQGGSFSATNVRNALDKLTKRVIELQERLDRALQIPDTDDGTLTLTLPDSIDRASTYLTFDADGNVAATTTLSTGTATFGSFGTTMAATATALAARTALGAGTIGEDLFTESTAADARSTIGAVIGTNVQAYDADLSEIAALTHTANYFMVGKSDGTQWTQVSPASAVTILGVMAASDVMCIDDDVVCVDEEVVLDA